MKPSRTLHGPLSGAVMSKSSPGAQAGNHLGVDGVGYQAEGGLNRRQV